ncbi:hypothetical protein JCM14635_08150 [Megalodesulfovibrio paquesii]
MEKITLLFLCWVILSPVPLYALQGKAVRITDGDTITVLRADHV